MLYLLDTNVVSDLMFQTREVTDRAERVGVDDRLVTCTIVCGEILYGSLAVQNWVLGAL